MGQAIADQNLYFLWLRGILGDSETDIPVHLGQLPLHFALDAGEGGPFGELKLNGGGFPRKVSAHSRDGASREDIPFRKTEFEEATMNCFIEEIYFLVELILKSLRTWIEIEENKAQDQK
jgi:hypothetical protein